MNPLIRDLRGSSLGVGTLTEDGGVVSGFQDMKEFGWTVEVCYPDVVEYFHASPITRTDNHHGPHVCPGVYAK